MANEVRERFKERKYSYKNKLMKTKKKQIIKLAIITPLLAAFSFFKEDKTNTTNKKVGTSIAFMGINPLYKLKKQQVLHIIATPAVSMSKFIYIHGYILSVLVI